MDEYIERELAIEALSRGDGCGNVCRRAIERILAADVAPVVHGRWITSHDEFCACSICKYPVYVGWNQTNYCPHCGAKMDGGGGDAAD